MTTAHIPKVLVIEDDPHCVYLLQRYSSASGCQLLHAEPPSTALSLAQHEHPDVIVLDRHVLGIDSAALMHTLKSDPQTYRIPVLLCSGVDLPLLGWEDEADAYLLKPILLADFVDAITRVGIHVIIG